MSMGRAWYQRQPRAFVGDTQLVTANLYLSSEDTLVPETDIDSVTFTVSRPGDDPAGPPAVDAAPGTVDGDGSASCVIPPSVNSAVGNYKGRAVFTYTEGGHTLQRSVPFEYAVVDPLETPAAEPHDEVVDAAWDWFLDCFDSSTGTPWLRDMSMAYFDRERIARFIPDVILEINSVFPQTSWTQDTYVYDGGDSSAILSLGLVLATIRHLMRSYVEQPNAVGAQVAFHDRQQYQQRWQQMYEVEKERFDRLLVLFKGRAFDVSRSSLLLGSKAGRLMQGTQRTRSAGRWY